MERIALITRSQLSSVHSQHCLQGEPSIDLIKPWVVVAVLTFERIMVMLGGKATRVEEKSYSCPLAFSTSNFC